MILTNEDYNQLTKIIAALSQICRNAVMSEEEEKRARQFGTLIFHELKAGVAAPASLNETEGFLKFTESEVSKMPKQFRKYFRYGGKNHRIRQKNNGVYEIRFMINGLSISASSKKLEIAKKKFIEKLHDSVTVKQAKDAKAIENILFKDFAKTWLETVKRPNIKDSTYSDYGIQFRVHLVPVFGDRPLPSIKPMEIRTLLNRYIEKENFRTADKLHGTLKSLFECARDEGIIAQNPMKNIPEIRFTEKNGVPLTVAEERYLIEQLFTTNHPCRYAMIFFLYTGIRRSELKSAIASDDWITVVTAKTRKGVIKTRRIPISPMLRPYMEHFTSENISFTDDRLSRVIPKFLPEHHLHDLRHTFITRAQECGIPKSVVKIWAGHAMNKHDMTESVYTHFSDEYQLKEIQKYNY